MNRRGIFVVFACIALFGAGCFEDAAPNSVEEQADTTNSFVITSDAFMDGQPIPRRYTCNGEDVSPAVSFANAPSEAASLALIMEDMDAPSGFTHWIVFNMPASVEGIVEGDRAPGALGTTSGERLGYEGPCPPTGQHRYAFTLYALRAPLNVTDGANAEQVRAAMEGQIISTATLMGTYGK